MAKRPTKAGSGKSAKAARGIPTPEQILEFVGSQAGHMGKREIARAFGIKGAARIELKQLLRRMVADGQLQKDARKLAPAGELPPVTVIEVVGQDLDGELHAVPASWNVADGGPAPRIVVIPEKTDLKAQPGVGERLLAKLTKTGDTGPDAYAYEARVIRRLTDNRQTVLGVFRKASKGPSRIVPVDKKARNDLEVAPGDEGGAVSGELVAAEIVRDRGRGLVRARVRERLGSVDDQRAISLIAIHTHGIPNRFSEAVLAETDALEAATIKGREDYRRVPLITIDPPDARDHDDAVWAEHDTDPANEGGFRVVVAIADVAHYVRPGTALDREALERGNSTYFPDRVVPMLPERISTDLCSLRPNEDRAALAATMVFDKSGRKLSHAFARVLMRSAAKLSYEQAQAAIDGRTDDTTGPLLEPVLKPLWAAWTTLEKARVKRAPLELDLPERKIRLDDMGHVASITVPERIDSQRLIEEFMIQANVAAAEALEKARSPLLYRVHDSPSPEKLRALAEFLATLDIKLARGNAMKPKDFNVILGRVRDTEVQQLVSDVVLRSQAQAVYAPENLGHFGLNLRRYAHFTSPIRRYADLIVHRSLIRAFDFGKDGLDDGAIARLEEIGEQVSMTERRSMVAERDTLDRLVASHLADRVGASFHARISGLVRAGLFVRLAESGADGFVPVSSLGQDYFVHDEHAHALIGQHTGETYRLGDPVEVRLLEVTPLAGGLRFEVLTEGKPGKPAGRRGPPRAGRSAPAKRRGGPRRSR